MPSTTILRPEWEHRIPDAEWDVYRRVIEEARADGIEFAFGGAFATAVYTGQFRNTKDFDFYIVPDDRDRMITAIRRAGLEDHFERLSYDQSWIYRGSRGDIIVDAIWEMANHQAQVDREWLRRGPELSLRGQRLRAIPIEELIWSKLYVLQRERTDWGDVLNLIHAQTAAIDWDHLLRRLSDDAPLLAGALNVFAWLAPDRVAVIPPGVWTRLGIEIPTTSPDPELSRRRAELLDSRPWFRLWE